MKKKILIITTGGTIAMTFDEEKGIIPADSLVDFLLAFPQLNSIADIEVFAYGNLPSPHITPQMMFDLARFVDDKILDYDGVVIAHGTDTIEETAYLFNLVLTTDKPVVFTAAMRTGGDLGLDGPRNVVEAVQVASSDAAFHQDVFVVMNDEIHSARDVIKSDTSKLNAFLSLDNGILGIIDGEKVIFYRRSLLREKLWTEKIDTRVELIKVCAGMDGKFIDCAVQSGARGIVIEGFGRGNIPPQMVDAVQRAIDADVIVILTTRTIKGRVLGLYGYTGGGKMLIDMGLIPAGDLKGPKARLKLMALLGKYQDTSLIKKFF